MRKIELGGTATRRTRYAALLLTTAALVGCGGSERDTPEGISCGDDRCEPGQVCCVDCDGTATCAVPGTECPATTCTATDGGTSDQGLECGGRRCESGRICCLDCDGSGQCLAPGSTCPGDACEQDQEDPDGGDPDGGDPGGGDEACGNSSCPSGSKCCAFCGGSIVHCVDPAEPCPSPPFHCPDAG